MDTYDPTNGPHPGPGPDCHFGAQIAVALYSAQDPDLWLEAEDLKRRAFEAGYQRRFGLRDASGTEPQDIGG
ncbi:hypothetical protein IWX78_001165 [Mycetocola sp. CAN_C7]|uniref:hypothetical protein n=1 Tax=Mycetocola sp. CAN_C7 TaxID=2787724 RepID=UPI0018CB8CAC